MSRVVTQPRPCEDRSRMVAPMSFCFGSTDGEREATRVPTDLAMRIGMEVRVRDEQTLTHYEQALKKTQAPLKPNRAGRTIWRATEPGCRAAWALCRASDRGARA